MRLNGIPVEDLCALITSAGDGAKQRNLAEMFPNPDYSRVKATQRRALRNEAMDLCLGAACELGFGNEPLK